MTSELTPEEQAFLDKHSGLTAPLPAEEVERIIEAGRKAAREARIPEVPHIEEIVAAFPPGHRDPLSVSRFIENGAIDHPTLHCEVGVREYLESGADPEPVLALAREADQWGM